MNIQHIPLTQLVPSKANVRRTGADSGIAELAANIKALGLLQNLQVRATENGKFEVVAGRRRLAALKRLAQDKAITKSAEIPCNVLMAEDPTEISLAENVMRLPMHPADQFEAFKTLADQGQGHEDIAARFGCAASTVKQRLRLASVSPKLFARYRKDEMSLDQLMAFTVSDDTQAQETVWKELAEWNRQPDSIRRALTKAHVEAADPKAVFVGIEAYVASGGGVLRDLFTPEHEGYLTDPALLDRLATERLEREAETIRAQGWKWVDIAGEIDHGALRRYGRVHSVQEPLSEAQQAEVDRLSGQHDALVEEYGDDPNPDEAAEIDALDEGIEALTQGSWHFLPEDKAVAGCVVGIDYEGGLDVVFGLIRPEDRTESDEPQERGGRTTGAKAKRDGSALPAPLVEELTAQRTLALRAMMAGNPDVALASVVHALTLPLFYDPLGRRTCLELRASSASLRGTEDSPAAETLEGRQETLREALPETPEALWDWLLAQTQEVLLDLLAFCAASSVNAVVKPHERSEERTGHADLLATALGLDMAQWWQPTGAAYLARVPKARILEAVREGVSPSAAENLANLKKDALVSHAEQRLAGTGWLPALLRAPVTTAAEPEAETLAA